MHETCGGPRPDQPPNLQRCDACSAALGLDRLTSSDDDDSRDDSDEEDTSLDGFIVSDGSDDESFDYNALVDLDDSDELPERRIDAAESISSASSSPPAVTSRGRPAATQRLDGRSKPAAVARGSAPTLRRKDSQATQVLESADTSDSDVVAEPVKPARRGRKPRA